MSQKLPSTDILRKTCSENMQQVYRRSMPKWDFNKLCNFIEIALWHGWSLINLPHILRTSYPKNTSEGLLLMNVRLAWYGLNIVLKFSSTTFDKILLTTGIFLVEMKITDLFCNFKKKVYERLIINKKKNSWKRIAILDIHFEICWKQHLPVGIRRALDVQWTSMWSPDFWWTSDAHWAWKG